MVIFENKKKQANRVMSVSERLHVYCFCVVCSLVGAVGRISFEKDQNMDVIFPPIMEKSVDSRIPDGHLRPLGWQRRSDGKIIEEKGMLLPKEFYTNYVQKNVPLMMQGAIKDTMVIKTWLKDDYLKEKYGQLNVSVTVKKDFVKKGFTVMKLKKFILNYMYEDWYLANIIPQEMAHELQLPKCLSCGTYFNRLQEAELWMSSGGTSSLLHSHEDHILHCVVFGRRDFILIKSEYRKNFDFIENYPTSIGGFSPLNMDRINAFEFTKIAETPWTHASLRGGDCIFIPGDYLHQVRSYGRSISYTVVFYPTLEIDLKGCKKNQDFKLTDANFVWTYVKGKQQLANIRFSAEKLREQLLLFIRARNKLYFQAFQHFYDKALKDNKDRPIAASAFRKIAKKEREYITREELQHLDEKKLQKLADILNGKHKKKRVEL